MLIKTKTEFTETLNRIADQDEIVVDTETSGLEVWEDKRLCGIGVSFKNNDSFYFPFRHQLNREGAPILALLEAPNVNLSIDLLPRVIETLRKPRVIIGQNIKFDLAALFQEGFDLDDHQELEETLIGARMYFRDRAQRMDLGTLSKLILGLDEGEYKHIFQEYLKKNGWQNHFDYAPPGIVGEYCESDCRNTFKIRDRLYEYIVQTEQVTVWEREKILLRVLWDMEKFGIAVDLDYCKNRIPKLEARLQEIRLQIWALCEKEFNVGSSLELNKALDSIGIKPISYSDAGNAKWSVTELLTLDHPVGGLLIEYRGLDKILSTYFKPILNHPSGVIHCSFKSWGTSTGRMSCIAGNTPIECPRDLKQYPDGIPVRELRKGQWIYSSTMDRKLCLRKVRKVWKNGIRDTLKILLKRNKSRDQILEITPDHLVKTQRGWIHAQELFVGERIISMNPRRGINENFTSGHAIFNGKLERFGHDHPTSGKNVEHRWIYAETHRIKNLSTKYDVHHEDHNSLNNTPENLKYLWKPEHLKEHNPEITKEEVELSLKEPYLWKYDVKTFERKCRKFDISRTSDEYRSARKLIHDVQVNKPKRVRDGWKKVNEKSVNEYKDALYYQVIKIEQGERQEVYDIDVESEDFQEDTHCFFGSGVLLHNCNSPNLQNIAKTSQNLAGNVANEEVMAALSAFLGARKGESLVDMKSASGNQAGGMTLSGMMSLSEKYSEEDDALVSVRRLYVPRKGFCLYLIDYGQMEMRVFADYVKDDALTLMMEDPNFDFHTHVAKSVWNVDEESELWKFYRTLAKAINFGLIFGIGTEKLAHQIQKPEEEARKYKQDYFDRFPKARTFMTQVKNLILSRGYVFNRFKRRYYIDAEKAYKGVNYLVQGTSADVVKGAMILVWQFLKRENLKSRILVQVHDELIVEVHDDEERYVVPKIKELMETRQIESYLPVDVSKGFPSWAAKYSVCLECFDKKEDDHICEKKNKLLVKKSMRVTKVKSTTNSSILPVPTDTTIPM